MNGTSRVPTTMSRRAKRYFTPLGFLRKEPRASDRRPLAALFPHRRADEEAAERRGQPSRAYPKRESTTTMMPPMVAPRA